MTIISASSYITSYFTMKYSSYRLIVMPYYIVIIKSSTCTREDTLVVCSVVEAGVSQLANESRGSPNSTIIILQEGISFAVPTATSIKEKRQIKKPTNVFFILFIKQLN